MSTEEMQSMDDRPVWEKYPDVMVDLETTGLSFDRNAILQITCVRFNLAEQTIQFPGHFNRCLTIPRTRFWDEDTRNWWLKKRDVLMSILGRGERPEAVLADLVQWVGNKASIMWAKPTHFDHSFLSSYCRDYGFDNPFHYREAVDMNSWIKGRYYPQDMPRWEWELAFAGAKHDALFDVLHQIKTVFAVYEDTQASNKGGFDKMMAERDAQILAAAPVDETLTDAPF